MRGETIVKAQEQITIDAEDENGICLTQVRPMGEDGRIYFHAVHAEKIAKAILKIAEEMPK